MSYLKLIEIVGMYRENDMIKRFCEFYKTKKISGLNYFEYSSVNQTTAIVTPLHEVHHESTCFLLEKKYVNESINTVLSAGRDLKKFLDFLLIWDIDLEAKNLDLKVVALGFITHLRVIDKYRPSRAVLWSYLQRIPMHQSAMNYGKITSVSFDDNHVLTRTGFEEYSVETISKIVSTSLAYLKFLKERTVKYKNINFDSIPIKKSKNTYSFLSGTLGNKEQYIFDVTTLLQLARIDTKSLDNDIKPIEDDVFSTDEIGQFFDAINDNDTQNRLLFTMQKCFGLRSAELANLKIKSNSIPNEFYNWDFNDAAEYLKEKLKGDIEFSRFNFWVCSVINRPNRNRNKQNKTRNRNVRLLHSLMSSNDFSGLLVSYLQERQFHLENSGITDHEYLFISYSNRSKFQPITGATVRSRYQSITDTPTLKNTFKKHSPHTFRHYFATYLIRVHQIDISDVSSLLGHADVQITRKTYLHYLVENNSSKDDDSSQADKILSVFKGED